MLLFRENESNDFVLLHVKPGRSTVHGKVKRAKHVKLTRNNNSRAREKTFLQVSLTRFLARTVDFCNSKKYVQVLT